MYVQYTTGFEQSTIFMEKHSFLNLDDDVTGENTPINYKQWNYIF